MTPTAGEHDVVIVGAGISGLSVADGLQRMGRNVHVLEARDRTGGRMLSVPVNGGHADLGPTWFWPNEPRIASLVAEFELPIHSQFAEGDGLAVARGEVHRGSHFAAPPALRFSNGAQSLSTALTDRLQPDTITYEMPVSRVERHDEHLLVHTAGQTYPASAVVLALPPSLVMAAGIVDAADLDASVAQTASQIPVWMGGITKAVAVYEHAFWRDHGLSGLISYPAGPFAEIHDMSGPNGSPAMLFGFGQATQHPLNAGHLVEQLASIFGGEAATPSAAFECDWSSEAFTTPTNGNHSQRYDLFGSPLLRTPSWDGRLHWTSTETASVAPGHIEGALQAAERTVESIAAE